MKIKGYLLFIFWVFLCGTIAQAQSSVSKDRSDSEVGRYQLFQGTYVSIDLKRQMTSTHTAIFLLDTKTGSVKRYVNKIDEEGKYIETWLPTELIEIKKK